MLNKKDSELIEITNKAIAELVYPKWELQKAYNYYNGKRDAEQFRYLEENFGIGNPTSVEFIPLIKKHIDALVGEYLGTPILPKVTCKDRETISKISREKELTIASELIQFLSKRLKSKVFGYIHNKEELVDTSIQEEIDKLREDLDQGFQSQYEVAAQNVITYLLQNRNTDFYTKLKTLLLDLLITGYTYFKVSDVSSHSDVQIEVLSPLNTFIDKNPMSPYIKDSRRAVVRKWLDKEAILNIYGRRMSKEDRDSIKELWRDQFDTSTYYVRQFEGSNGTPLTDGIAAGTEVVPGYPTGPYKTYNYKLIPVYEVEWIETDNNFVMQRYSTVRIGDSIYILDGLDKNVVRSQDNPTYCSLTVNGVYFVNRNAEPYSLMLACAKLQDKYDVLHFYRDNLIASSGTIGDWIDVSMLPSFLGDNLPERLVKWSAYKKAGKALIDTSQEGRQDSAQLNTIFNGYDDTIKATAVQAIQMAIDSIEATASSITGVFRERLNGIEQRDAVTNIKQGYNNSFTITKQYYQQMDLVVLEMLYDSLNTAKRVYKNGLKGTIILGDKQQKVFTALPEHFTFSDYDIHISTTTDTIKDLEYIRQIIPEFIKNGALESDIIFEIITTKSLTELKNKVRKALKKRKEENNQIQQLAQQNEQLQQQLKEMQQQLNKYKESEQQFQQAQLQLNKEKNAVDSEIQWYKAKTDRQYKEAAIEEQKRRTAVEINQQYDGNPYNDRIRQINESTL